MIDDFIVEMLTLYEKVHHDIRESTFDGVKKNIVTREKIYNVTTNLRAVQRAMAYILEIIQKAEALRYIDDVEDLEGTLDAWKEGVPSIEEMEKIETRYR